jgi:NTE family protein/lysophospholipid hydrolase
MTWVTLQPGDYLFRQEEPGGYLYLVYKGNLKVVIARDDGEEITVAEVGPGKPLGEIQFLTGGTRTASVSALEPSLLIQLSHTDYEQLSQRFPEILRHMGDIIRQRLRRDQLVTMLPELCGPIDMDILEKIEAETEWIWLPQGQALFHEDDPGDSFFLLISGRLYAAVRHRNQEEQVVGEIRRGEIVGEMSMFTGEPRSASIYAARNSEVVKFSKTAFERITSQFPSIMMRIVQIVVRRLQQSQSSVPLTVPGMNVAIVPASHDVALREFATRLVAALETFGHTLYLHSERLDQLLAMTGVAQTPEYAPNNVRLAAWLDEQETKHRIVVYETDLSSSPWTRRCIQRADRIVIVANALGEPEISEIERELLGVDTSLHKTPQSLVLVHPDGAKLPTGTQQWLTGRPVDDHHHLRWDTDKDFGRLARFLTGNAIGLVLGGGGARGCSHIGVIRALLEAGIPIDMIGGTSIGGAIAALHAMGVEHQEMLRINRLIWLDSKPFADYTLPIMSLITGRKFEHVAQVVYGDRPIEDLWVNYFCVSTNLTTAEVVTHRAGSLWRALRATASLPGIAVPFVQGSHLLVDGGVLNNLPVDVMRELCGGIVIAVNVSPEKDLSFDYEQFPSPWKVLWNRMMPVGDPMNVPNILDMLLRATMVGSIHQTNRVKGAADFYLQPPLDRFKLLDFKALEEIAQVGYDYTKTRLEGWRPSFLRA